MSNLKDKKICVVGLGYVGLPLAIAFGQQTEINAFDIKQSRIEELKQGVDYNNDVSKEELKKAKINFSADPNIIKNSNFIIIAVPTPIDANRKPDIDLLIGASSIVGKQLNQGDIVVYESTVYPGCTERDCIPILAKESNLKYPGEFKVGYSPERINPGDTVNTLDKIVKVVSGCDQQTLDTIADVYSTIIKAGVHKASSIKVAEAAKIIENTQRDVNIALINELKIIFDRANINWQDVLKASNTKWNFLDFKPGLVGGHCIGVDPYYLANEAIRLGYNPRVILAGRTINDSMGVYEAKRLINYLADKEVAKDAKLLILGATFKPNISDIRNSKVQDIVNELKKEGYQVDIHEPHVKTDKLFGCNNIKDIANYDIIIKAVRHDAFKDIKFDYEIIYN